MPGPAFIPGDSVDLRTIEREDLSFLQTYVNHPTVWRRIGRPDPVTAADEQRFYEDVVCGDDGVHLLVTTDVETPVGIVSLTGIEPRYRRGELGYWIAPPEQNQGYGSEAAAMLVEHGFRDRGLHRIDARVFASNVASQQLLASLGFDRDGRLRDAAFVDGSYEDVFWYGVLQSEWETIRADVLPATVREQQPTD